MPDEFIFEWQRRLLLVMLQPLADRITATQLNLAGNAPGGMDAIEALASDFADTAPAIRMVANGPAVLLSDGVPVEKFDTPEKFMALMKSGYLDACQAEGVTGFLPAGLN